MRSLFLFFLLIFSAAGFSNEEQITNIELATKCEDFVALKRTENSGYCMGYFLEYFKLNSNYWLTDRSKMSDQKKFWWDTFLPCRLPTKDNKGLVKEYISFIKKNPSYNNKIPLETIMIIYQDNC